MFLALLWLFALSHAIHHVSASPAVTAAPFFSPRRPRDRLLELERRDSTTELSTCGYLNGNIDSPRTAQPGFDCRIDTAHGIWGFCPTTVISATDCGLAAACKDSGTCTSICRFNTNTALTTFTCANSGTLTNYCSTALLTFGVDQTYGYLACGASSETQHYDVSATVTPSTSLTASSSTKTSSASSGSSSSTGPSSGTTSSVPLPTTSTADSNSSKGNSGSSVGPIVGGVVGGLALVCASVVAVIYIVKRNRSRTPTDQDPRHAPETPLAPPQPPAQSLYEVAASNEEAKYPFVHASQQDYSYAVELPSNTHN
ncbi:hypothetical protein CMQ_4145 [Grosmannia clavigera kw1407]|uniref:Uncharacterized protein n=1 Tax=Grosmannia clavigera (strain kw1407 / UAMH 11150) TaxID=655863 RepID=F0X901_GROCL|nr:uncharacterized protein CMQ_4145 [Grosmannia clavigera kw1407]EFX06076.1 hypothetical protein CMQ_4145 [Grosmannia clavigera kw1407]